MDDIEEYIKEWIKLGYTDEQSDELARISILGCVGDIEAHVADKMLYKTLKNMNKKNVLLRKLKKYRNI